MSSPFAITRASDAVPTLDAGQRRATVTFTVTNMTYGSVSSMGKILPRSPAKAEWFRLEPSEQEFRAQETLQFIVHVNVPLEVEAGEYAFQLVVADVTDPDDRATTGEITSFAVPARDVVEPEPEPSSFPWLWVAIGGGALVLVGIGITVAILMWSGGDDEAEAAAEEVTIHVDEEPEPEGCRSDEDCPARTTCRDTECVTACGRSDECAAGWECSEGACVARDEFRCTEDDDCRGKETCNRAEGSEEGTCEEQCTQNSDCAPGQRCVSNECEVCPERFWADCDDDTYARAGAQVTCDQSKPVVCGQRWTEREPVNQDIDCKDEDPKFNPGIQESWDNGLWGNGIDEDCDGREACFFDEDFNGAARLEHKVEIVTPGSTGICTRGKGLAARGTSPDWTEICTKPPRFDQSKKLKNLDENQRGALCDVAVCGVWGYGGQRQLNCNVKKADMDWDDRQGCAKNGWTQGHCGELTAGQLLACLSVMNLRLMHNSCDWASEFNRNPACAPIKAHCVD